MAADRTSRDIFRESNPYVGPRPFRQGEADRFFGRSVAAENLLNAWAGERVTVLHGPSAAGKTSLLQAGLFPQLSGQASVDVLPIGGLTLPASVPSSRNRYSFALLSRWVLLEEANVRDMSISDFLTARTANFTEPAARSILAVIDHFDELFDSFPDRQSERDEFIDELAAAIHQFPSLKLLIVVNDEQQANLRLYEHVIAPFQIRYIKLGRLTSEQALEAITRPLEGTGRSFGAGVAGELVEQLGIASYTDTEVARVAARHDEIEALFLQIVCRNLWSSLAVDEELITANHLRAFGDIDRALAGYYDSAVRAVQLETGESEERLRTWIESTFITEHGTRGTACRGLLTTAGMPNQVVDSFADTRIIATEYRSRSAWYQLGHDRMIVPIQEANSSWRSAHGLGTSQPAESRPPEELVSAAEAALAAGNFPTAHRFAAKAIEYYRKAADTRRLGYTLTLQSSIAGAEGDYREAERYLQDALSEFALLQDRELIARTLSAIADVNFARGDYAKAEQLQRAAVERLPVYVDAIVGLAYAEWYEGSPANAEATFALALGQDASSGRAAAGRGQVLAELAEYDSALANLDIALASVLPLEEEVDARSARALALSGLGRFEEADEEFAAARRQAPDRARTHRRAGNIAAMRQQNELAIIEFQLALDAKPSLPPWDEDHAHRFLAQLLEAGALLC
jgi:tetratricopeptide (TPR) repeat protein